MAILKVFSIRDTALEAYFRPFYHTHSNGALRIFKDEINNSQSDLFKHYADFILFELGEWDDSNARFDLHPDPVQISRGKDVFESQPAAKAA